MSSAPDHPAEEFPSPETIEVTRAMRDAGEAVLDELMESYPPSLLVEEIYKAMRAVEKDRRA